MANHATCSLLHFAPTCRGLLYLAWAALAGCAAAPTHLDAVSGAPEAGRALVVGWGHSAAEQAREAFTVARGTRVSQLYVVRANGQKSGFGDNVARLPAGVYQLTINCGIYIDARFFEYETIVPATLGVDRVYHLRAAPEGRRCQPFLEDTTGKGG